MARHVAGMLAWCHDNLLFTIKPKFHAIMKKWKCTVCGYVHEGETAPEECPLCGVGPEDFEEVVE